MYNTLTWPRNARNPISNDLLGITSRTPLRTGLLIGCRENGKLFDIFSVNKHMKMLVTLCWSSDNQIHVWRFQRFSNVLWVVHVNYLWITFTCRMFSLWAYLLCTLLTWCDFLRIVIFLWIVWSCVIWSLLCEIAPLHNISGPALPSAFLFFYKLWFFLWIVRSCAI